MQLLESYSDILTDTPGRTTAIHVITKSDIKPVVTPQYPINLHYEEIIKELKELLEMKIVEFSNSEYSLPLLPIKKKDGSLRLCLDYRKLNTITLVPQEPLPNLECFFTKLSKAIYFQRFDLSGGYWQIPLEKNL